MGVIFRYINGKIRPIKVDDTQTTNEYMNNKIRGGKKYIAENYTPGNVNECFSKITNYTELEEFRNDYFNKIKFMPYIVPIKNSTRQWVDFIEKIDENNISFSVLSEDYAYSRKTKSSIKNFVKNYKVHQE